MPKEHTAYWNASRLKARGWSPQQMRLLLPRPRVVYYSGRPVRQWAREDVLAAEARPDFEKGGPAPAEPVPPGAAGPAAAALTQAWEAAAPPQPAGEPPELLAVQYHRAVLARLPALSRGKNVRMTQVNAWLGEFLSLERNPDPKRLPATLKNFLKAGGWLGQNLHHSLARKVLEKYPALLRTAARQALEAFTAQQPQADLTAFLTAEGFPPAQLLAEGLESVWSVWYVPQAIRTSLSLLMALNPKDEYPEARAMHRRFVLHLGGTNTGKTYYGLQRLMRAETGVYLAPLRLLALEAQEAMLDGGVSCGLSTGEESDLTEDDTHLAATAEKADLAQYWDAAVIDECQMIADPVRGYAWTRAILGLQCPEIHLCAAPEARDLLIRIVESCGDTVTVQEHRRRVPLVCMNQPVDYQRVQPGDALITFSKIGVLSVAEDLRQNGKEPAIIYGALPYATRRRQMEGFLSGKMQYIVSTDAIGMGLNLPIRRVIFMETEKFDGIQRRPLRPEEIQQIAGRAGRYGMYHCGYVGATQDLHVIRAGLNAAIEPLEHAVVGFSDLVLRVEFDLLEVLTEWNKMPTAEPYRKLDISRYIALITKLREMGFVLTKEQELRAANVPFDETEEPVRELFFELLRKWQQQEPLDQPGYPEDGPTLPELEQYYRKLDLYYSFAKAFGCPVDEDKLYDTRQRVAEEINQILLYRLRNNIRFCDRCGRALPLHHRGRLCDACYARTRRRNGS